MKYEQLWKDIETLVRPARPPAAGKLPSGSISSSK